MTRTQQVVMLIEAAGPLTFDRLKFALQWPGKTLDYVIRRLVRWGVLTIQNIDQRRHYVMVQA